VCVPLGAGTAYDRLTNATAASIRVIAIDIPNAPQTNPWQSFVTSTKQLQDLTGFSFFSALPNNLAWALRSKVDGQAAAAPTFSSFTPSSGSQSNSVTLSGGAFDTITNVSFNGTSAPYTITATNTIIALVPVGASTGQITVRGMGGSATSVSSFTVAPPVLPDFTITPGGSFTSSGSEGGSFSPSSQTYTLNNTNATSLNWGVGKNASWLDLSATSGTLAGGASTDITVSVNGAANSLAGGIYSDSVTFSNSTTGGWVPRNVNLTVLTLGQLSVSSVLTFNATTQVGGPFSPSSTDYTLSNTGSVSLNWTANATASWLDLSATSGTLAAGSSTVVTGTINSNAVNLSQGNYSEVIGFTNTTNHIGDTMRDVSLDVVSFGFFDDIGSFSTGNLVGQASWQEPGATNSLWTFEGAIADAYAGVVGTSVGNIAADISSGVATGFHASALSAWTDVSGNGSPQSWSVNHWGVGDFFQFQVNTLGIGSIHLAWDQVSSSTGPRDFLLQWSTNGTTFTTITAYSVNANVSNIVRLAWNFNVYEPADHYTANLSTNTAIENQSAVYFRIVDNSTVSAGGGNVGVTGTDRVDNFLVSGVDAVPIQVSGGAAWIVGGQTAITPNTSKDFLLTTNVTVFAGLVVNVTNAPVANSGTPSFFAALASANGGVGDVSMANYELTAKAGDNANTNYVLGARTTGESGAPFVFGTGGLSYGTSYRVIIRTDPLGTNTIIYVNPTSGVLNQQTPYLTASGSAGITPATMLGSFILTQSKNGSLATVGAGIGKVCAASDYASVYTFLTGANPPVASFTGTPTTGTEALNVTFTDTSTGNITNRFWDFGDGGTANVTTNVVNYTYYSGGTYTVTLIVSGPDGVSTNTQPNYINVLTGFQAWQLQYFGTTNGSAAATADPDGDGQNNFAEFQAGTDPTNSASVFRITSVVRTNNDIQITWSCGSGAHYYYVQTNSPAANGSYTNNFTNLSGLIFTGGSTGSYTDSGGATNTPTRYYRVLLYLGPM
jgi:PKD repeat protein